MKPINLNYNMMDMRRQYRTVQRHKIHFNVNLGRVVSLKIKRWIVILVSNTLCSLKH